MTFGKYYELLFGYTEGKNIDITLSLATICDLLDGTMSPSKKAALVITLIHFTSANKK